MAAPGVLVVEDDRELAAPLCELLIEAGYRAEHVMNGAEALARLRAANPPSLVLLDLRMPVMDGWEFLAQRKLDPSLLPTRVVVMSADDSAKARAADADAFVAKPFVRQDLLDTLETLFNEETGREARTRDLRLDQLASLGRLAAGMAHEINNPLTFVAGNLALLEDELASAPELRELVRGALEGAERIGRIVGGLKLLVRSADDEPAAVELAPVLESALHLAGNELRHRARVVRELAPGLTAFGCASRMVQLFLNLLLTAAQRLPEGGAAEHHVHIAARAAGHRVVVELRDSGTSLSQEGQRQLVDGLGMTICRQLVAELGAQLQINIAPTFLLRVLLPVAPPSPPVATPNRPREARRSRLLIVDDEPRIGAVLARALGRDHDVTALVSAREALARLQAGDDWDLIVCDMMMPEMSGMELHAELERCRPLLARRMVFLTGGAFTPRAQAFLAHVDNPCLDKPIDMARLRALLRERLA
jgi:CheY-like chemotaxis protein